MQVYMKCIAKSSIEKTFILQTKEEAPHEWATGCLLVAGPINASTTSWQRRKSLSCCSRPGPPHNTSEGKREHQDRNTLQESTALRLFHTVWILPSPASTIRQTSTWGNLGANSSFFASMKMLECRKRQLRPRREREPPLVLTLLTPAWSDAT